MFCISEVMRMKVIVGFIAALLCVQLAAGDRKCKCTMADGIEEDDKTSLYCQQNTNGPAAGCTASVYVNNRKGDNYCLQPDETLHGQFEKCCVSNKRTHYCYASRD